MSNEIDENKKNYTLREVIDLEEKAIDGDTAAQDILNGIEGYQEMKEGKSNRLAELAKSVVPIDFDAMGIGDSALEEIMETEKLLAQSGIDEKMWEQSAMLADLPPFNIALSELDEAPAKMAGLSAFGEDVLNSAMVRDSWMAEIGNEMHKEQMGMAVPVDIFFPTVEEKNLEETKETNRLLREQNQELRKANNIQKEYNENLLVIVQSQMLTSANRAKQFGIEIPSKPTVLKRWKVIWKKCRSQWDTGKNATDICDWLNMTHPDFACQIDTLRKILTAGEAGDLD